MVAIRYILVSFFLFCDKTNSVKLTAQYLQESVNSPTFGLTSPKNYELFNYFPNSRILTFTRYIYVDGFSINDKTPKSINYDKTSKNRLTVNETPLNNHSNNFDLEKIIDNVDNCSENMKSIYEGIVFLFVQKWEKLHTEDNILKEYPKNLGFDEKIMNLINRSMTELMHLQRRDEIIVNQLASSYLYSCDLENTFKNNQKKNEEKNNEIKEQFSKYLLIYKYYQNQLMNENNQMTFIENIIINLEKTLTEITEKVKTSFNITVPLIKNWALIIKTNDVTVKMLQDTSVKVNGIENELSLSEATLLFSEKNSFPTAMVNHLFVLQQVILHMYGFAMAHFELSVEICKHYELDENDKKTIDGFRTYMNFFMTLFLDRFFELEGTMNYKFIKEILHLLDFMFSKMDNNSANQLSIWNYNEKNEDKKVSLNQYISNLSDLATNAFLNFFNVENKTSWKNERTINFDDEKPSKEEIISLMNENFKIGMEGLVVFIMDFDVGLELFEEPAKNEFNTSV